MRTATVAVFTEFLQRCPRTASDQVTTDSQGGFKYGRHINQGCNCHECPPGLNGTIFDLIYQWSNCFHYEKQSHNNEMSLTA